ncbi:SH3-like domain-containing protein [Frigidibacter sp. ROC022]|uniref:SH3-like domain-containing protein n=1 Tax=Frigidibacter sp. ROC022 TaxID=2971796 RepID=UPI0030838DF9
MAAPTVSEPQLPVRARVRVRSWAAPGHIRTPWYLRGREGRIERALGAFPNPEQLALRQPADPVPLYRVRFTMAEVWGKAAETPTDTLDAEIFAHWLEPLDAA